MDKDSLTIAIELLEDALETSSKMNIKKKIAKALEYIREYKVEREE